MSIDLTVPNALSGTLETVSDQNGTASGLQLGTESTQVVGQDVVGQSLPLVIVGTPVNGQQSYGRILRLQRGDNTAGQFFDIGIDENGTLFVNNGQADPSDPQARVLTITQAGAVTINKLVLPNLTQAPGSSDDVTVDPQGNVYKQ
jgi:hypothetical protein